MRRLLLLAAVLCLPAPASAATFTTVDYECYEGSHFCTFTAEYTAAPGERNDVTYTDAGQGYTDIHDAGATVTAGRYCRSLDANTARCFGDSLALRLRDGDDRALPGGPYPRGVDADGGIGDDTLTGGDGDDHLYVAGGAGRDALDGGAGVDTADYDGEPPIVVNLANGTGPDAIARIETVAGTEARRDRRRRERQRAVRPRRRRRDQRRRRQRRDRGRRRVGPDLRRCRRRRARLVDDGHPRPSGELLDCGAGDDVVTEMRRAVLRGCERLGLPLGFFAPTFDPGVTFSGHSARMCLRCSLLFGADARRHGCLSR